MKVLVTGGYGFIGSHLVNSLAEKGYKVLIYDKCTYATEYVVKENINNTWRRHGDTCDVRNIKNLFRIHDIERIYHLAAETHVDNSIDDPNVFMNTNVLGTQNLLNVARDQNIPFIHVSTDEVYGALRKDDKNWNENQPVMPRSPYAASKAASDLVALSYYTTYGLDVRVTRCCNNFGIHQHGEKLIPKSIMSAIKDKEIKIYGDGTNMREWIHAKDHADGIILVSEKGKPGEIYNIGTGEEKSNNDIAKMIVKYTKSNAKIRYIKDRPGHDYRYALNFGKIKRLGFKPTRTINDKKEWDELIQFYTERL